MKRTSLASNGRATSGQKTQLVQVTTSAGRHSGTLINRKLGLDHDGFNRLLKKSGELKTAIAEFTLAKAKELSCSQFSKEVTDSSHQYPKEFQLKTLEEQDQILHTLFPGLGLTDLSSASRKLPKNAEAYFLIPRWEKIAPTYNEAVERVLELIASQRALHNYSQGELGSDRLQEGLKKSAMMKIIGKKQKYDILVIPAQLGMLYRGSSVRRAREMFGKNEFGFGAFEVGIIALTHPDRFVHFDDLDTYCPGDEYATEVGRVFSGAPVFRFGGDKLRFGTRDVSSVDDRYGSVSGFLPR